MGTIAAKKARCGSLLFCSSLKASLESWPSFRRSLPVPELGVERRLAEGMSRFCFGTELCYFCGKYMDLECGDF